MIADAGAFPSTPASAAQPAKPRPAHPRAFPIFSLRKNSEEKRGFMATLNTFVR